MIGGVGGVVGSGSYCHITAKCCRMVVFVQVRNKIIEIKGLRIICAQGRPVGVRRPEASLKSGAPPPQKKKKSNVSREFNAQKCRILKEYHGAA